MPGRRVRLYVDGFNLYYGCLKGKSGSKWLDLAALARALFPGDDTSVRYFTARVSGRTDPSAPARQKLYLSAIDTSPEVEITYGKFKTHPTRMALVKPGPFAKTAEVWKTEEKGSDVNLATWLLLDGVDGLFDQAVVISDDSDLTEPIAQSNKRHAPTHVISPRGVYQGGLAAAAATWRRLDPKMVAACQLPAAILLPSGNTITRPPTW